jgi:hypothetical protein
LQAWTRRETRSRSSSSAAKRTPWTEAEELYLDRNLGEILRLFESPLSDAEFRAHPLIQLLMARGSRGFEDSLT